VAELAFSLIDDDTQGLLEKEFSSQNPGIRINRGFKPATNCFPPIFIIGRGFKKLIRPLVI